MTTLAYALYNGYKQAMQDYTSPITKDWFMVGSPFNLLLVISGYLYFCMNLGPRYMKDRKPYELKNVIMIYNIFQIFISLYIFYEATIYIFFTDFNFCCQGLHHPESPEALRIANAAWIYYMVKLLDLMDTVFFVLRKSNRQITTLHLHHHSLMIIASWITATFIPGGQNIIVGLINTLVHIVMYTYYLLSGLGGQFKKYLWWKKYLTMMQLVQFVIIGAHAMNSLFYTCSYPVFLKYLVVLYAFVFIHMFGKFYYITYIKRKDEKTKNGSTATKKNVELTTDNKYTN